MKAVATFPLWLMAGLAAGLEPRVPAFEYTLSTQLIKQQDGWSFSTYDHHALVLKGLSTKRVPGSSPYYASAPKLEHTREGFEAVVTEQAHITAMPEYPKDRSERSFHFDIRSLSFPPNGERLLRVRFADATDVYRLRYAGNEGLHIEPVELESGTPAPARLRSFRNIHLEEDGVTWQCNPITTSATKEGEFFWKNDIGMDGQPASIHSLDKVLLIRTTAGHAFYVLKQTGEVVYYAKTDLAGKDPWEDILPFWEAAEENAKWFRRWHEFRRKHREAITRGETPPAIPKEILGRRPRVPDRFPLIRAAALLNEPRAIPLLIGCIGNGFGLPERAAAVAALELMNGNKAPWEEARRLNRFLHVIPMDRVRSEQNRQAEQAKWREVFGI